MTPQEDILPEAQGIRVAPHQKNLHSHPHIYRNQRIFMGIQL